MCANRVSASSPSSLQLAGHSWHTLVSLLLNPSACFQAKLADVDIKTLWSNDESARPLLLLVAVVLFCLVTLEYSR